ncbi:MAG: AAA family ATPase [Frisingicoccus sp.]|uniref:TrlF family AAA-like ATPase n=1 Tax=Frisingicoccus sp. TaxID=1918627 RepID=UPI0026317DBF|nr:AAA family ATPase [Frisingicoccus sp.]MDD6232883.1 AAA family ATPase [Frisingicoccus sp.]
MKEYSRGSEWRRWDLHVHTPGTNKNDQYEGTTIEECWDGFYRTISDYVGDGSDKVKSIVSIGITDYLSIENYKKVIAEKRLPDTIKLVIPNVELRMTPMSRNEGINIHFLFNPVVVDELEDRFFSKLSFEYKDRPYSATKAQLVSLGKALDSSLTEDKAYLKGVGQFIPSVDSLKKLFSNDPELRENTIIIVSNSSNDGVTGAANNFSHVEANSSDFDATRQSIYQFVDAIFSGNPSDISYFLGEKSDSPDEVIRKCGSLKPCFHGCDAHTNAKLFEPDNQRYCWIKSDPSFNGLKQVLYEPKDRVRISPLMPEEKSDYHVIDRIVIDDPDFSPEPIQFNDKLSCIIGGKSTGKSILLHNLALTIDKNQVEEKTEKSKTKTRVLTKVKVFWKDGEVNETGVQNDSHKIVYIPQTYLNQLSDENEEKTEIDSIVEEIILQNDNARISHEQMLKEIREYKPSLDKRIYDAVQINEEIQSIKKEMAEIGSRAGIEKQLDGLKKQKEIESKELSISEEDISKYDTAVSELTKLKVQVQTIENDISIVDSIVSVVIPVETDKAMSDDVRKDISDAVSTIKEKADELWKEYKLKIIQKYQTKREKTVTDMRNSEIVVDELKEQVESNEAIAELSKRIQDEEQRLLTFRDYDKKIDEKSEELNKIISDLVQTFKRYDDIQERYAASVNGEGSSLNEGSELTFSVLIPFRTEAFCQRIKQLFDNRVLKSKKDIINVEDFNIDQFDETALEKLIKACLNQTIPFSKSFTPESALRSILDNWYNVTYNVKMGDDLIDAMSPGKKALVLLKLLISLAESKSPILIDQPEDDLDNKSISDDLITFIKKKKIERQIIVVTHNANVVVSGDAEQVIVANQRGNTTPNNKFRFEYRTGSIEDDLPVYDDSGTIIDGILNAQGIQQHICDILEGGEKAFAKRKNKYNIKG